MKWKSTRKRGVEGAESSTSGRAERGKREGTTGIGVNLQTHIQ